jgi:hypothetical protein
MAKWMPVSEFTFSRASVPFYCGDFAGCADKADYTGRRVHGTTAASTKGGVARMRWPALSLGILLPALVSGCTSMSSTMVTRDESNQTWTRHRCLQGVPITLKVPTHVKVYVIEHHYLQRVKCEGSAVARTQRLTLPYVVRDFAQEFIYTEKIFTVDFRRPAAGTYNLHLDMTEDQYIEKVQHDVTDQTIAQVGNLIRGAAPGGLLPSPRSAIPNPEDFLFEVTSVVAVGIFEIDAPDFELQLSGFLNCHLNQAHDAWVVPPPVTAIRRAPLMGFDGDANLCQSPSALWPARPEPIHAAPGPQQEHILTPPPDQLLQSGGEK